MKHLSFLFALAVVVLSGCANSSVPLVSKPVKAVFLGDSVTAGEGVGSSAAYPALLQERHGTLQVITQGRPGWSAKSFLKRQTEVWAQLPMDADLFFIQLGANDLRETGHKPESPANAARQIGALVELLKRHSPDAEIVVLSPPDAFPERFSAQVQRVGFSLETAEQLKALDQELARVARQEKVRFVSLAGIFTAADTLDGFHPNHQGHQKIAAEIWKQLRGKLIWKAL
jgi:lysophospholipase L1-like esterase